MSSNPFRQVMRRIRRVVYHIGVFDGALPRIREEAPELTRAYLTVLQDSLPDLKHLVRYVADTVPVVGRMMGLVDRGTTDLAQASEMLRDVKRSTQLAVEEILAVLDRVNPLLDQVTSTERADAGHQEMIGQARGQLLLILNALQFQDITAQQIEATNALLADLGHGLGSLMEGLGAKTDGLARIEVAEGTFDQNARYDRRRAGVDQEAVDRILAGDDDGSDWSESAKSGGNGQAAPEPVGETVAAAQTEDGGEAVDQDEIDALLNGTQGG